MHKRLHSSASRQIKMASYFLFINSIRKVAIIQTESYKWKSFRSNAAHIHGGFSGLCNVYLNDTKRWVVPILFGSKSVWLNIRGNTLRFSLTEIMKASEKLLLKSFSKTMRNKGEVKSELFSARMCHSHIYCALLIFVYQQMHVIF